MSAQQTFSNEAYKYLWTIPQMSLRNYLKAFLELLLRRHPWELSKYWVTFAIRVSISKGQNG